VADIADCGFDIIEMGNLRDFCNKTYMTFGDIFENEASYDDGLLNYITYANVYEGENVVESFELPLNGYYVTSNGAIVSSNGLDITAGPPLQSLYQSVDGFVLNYVTSNGITVTSNGNSLTEGLGTFEFVGEIINNSVSNYVTSNGVTVTSNGIYVTEGLEFVGEIINNINESGNAEDVVDASGVMYIYMFETGDANDISFIFPGFPVIQKRMGYTGGNTDYSQDGLDVYDVENIINSQNINENEYPTYEFEYSADTVYSTPVYAKMFNFPTIAYVGENINSILVFMLPTTSVAYAVLHNYLGEEGSRVAFSNNQFPPLAPMGVGEYVVQVYTTPDTGTGFLLDESPVIISMISSFETYNSGTILENGSIIDISNTYESIFFGNTEDYGDAIDETLQFYIKNIIENANLIDLTNTQNSIFYSLMQETGNFTDQINIFMLYNINQYEYGSAVDITNVINSVFVGSTEEFGTSTDIAANFVYFVSSTVENGSLVDSNHTFGSIFISNISEAGSANDTSNVIAIFDPDTPEIGSLTDVVASVGSVFVGLVNEIGIAQEEVLRTDISEYGNAIDLTDTSIFRGNLLQEDGISVLLLEDGSPLTLETP